MAVNIIQLGNIGGVSDANVVIKGETIALNKIMVNTTTVWERMLVLFENGVIRDGDSFVPLFYFNGDGDDPQYVEGVMQDGALYGMCYQAEYDRIATGGGYFTTPIDITNFSKLCVTISDAVIPNSSYSRIYIGAAHSTDSEFFDEPFFGSHTEDETWMPDAYAETSTSGAQTLTLDLTEYKATYGNSCLFVFAAHKMGNYGGNTDENPISVTITKVWAE